MDSNGSSWSSTCTPVEVVEVCRSKGQAGRGSRLDTYLQQARHLAHQAAAAGDATHVANHPLLAGSHGLCDFLLYLSQAAASPTQLLQIMCSANLLRRTAQLASGDTECTVTAQAAEILVRLAHQVPEELLHALGSDGVEQLIRSLPDQVPGPAAADVSSTVLNLAQTCPRPMLLQTSAVGWANLLAAMDSPVQLVALGAASALRAMAEAATTPQEVITVLGPAVAASLDGSSPAADLSEWLASTDLGRQALLQHDHVICWLVSGLRLGRLATVPALVQLAACQEGRDVLMTYTDLVPLLLELARIDTSYAVRKVGHLLLKLTDYAGPPGSSTCSRALMAEHTCSLLDVVAGADPDNRNSAAAAASIMMAAMQLATGEPIARQAVLGSQHSLRQLLVVMGRSWVPGCTAARMLCLLTSTPAGACAAAHPWLVSALLDRLWDNGGQGSQIVWFHPAQALCQIAEGSPNGRVMVAAADGWLATLLACTTLRGREPPIAGLPALVTAAAVATAAPGSLAREFARDEWCPDGGWALSAMRLALQHEQLATAALKCCEAFAASGDETVVSACTLLVGGV